MYLKNIKIYIIMDSVLESYDFETDSNIETTTNFEYIGHR